MSVPVRDVTWTDRNEHRRVEERGRRWVCAADAFELGSLAAAAAVSDTDVDY